MIMISLFYRAEVPEREEVGSTPSPEPEEETRIVSAKAFYEGYDFKMSAGSFLITWFL